MPAYDTDILSNVLVLNEEDTKTLGALSIVEESYKSIYAETKPHYLAGTRTDLPAELGKWARADVEFANVPVSSVV